METSSLLPGAQRRKYLTLLQLHPWFGASVSAAVLINSSALRISPPKASSEINEVSGVCQESNLAEIARISDTKLVLEPGTGGRQRVMVR